MTTTPKPPSAAAVKAAEEVMSKCVPDRFQNDALKLDLAKRIECHFAPLVEASRNANRVMKQIAMLGNVNDEIRRMLVEAGAPLGKSLVELKSLEGEK